MNTNSDGGPAFPQTYTFKAGARRPDGTSVPDGMNEQYIYHGMSLRDWFAGMALCGMCSNPDISAAMSERGMKPFEVRESLADSAYSQADRMLKVRE